MSHPKILYITPALSVGGAEKFLILLSNSLVNEKEKQILVSLKDVNTLRHELDPKIDFITLPRKSKFDLDPVRKLRALIRTEEPGIIFCINFYSYVISRVAMLGLKTKAKRIISYHSTIHVTRKEHWLHKLYSKLLTKKDSIITVSSNQAKYTAREYNIPATKFTTIHNGIDVTYWQPSADTTARNEIRKKYNIDPQASVIVMTAALRIEKNHVGAVRALHLLHTAFQQKAYLLLVGDGVMKDEITRLAKELNLEDFVKITGMQKDVKPYYLAGDLFTLCSTSVETFSIAALEAMSCGLPCVLTDIGGAREMVKDGVNGYICDTTDADIARKWSMALQETHPRATIHALAAASFSSEKMLSEYRKIM